MSKRGYLFALTCFDDADRVATALVFANNALAAGGDALVWTSLEGVKLAKKDAVTGLLPKSFPPVAERARSRTRRQRTRTRCCLRAS